MRLDSPLGNAIFLTGVPSVGKTTVLMRAIDLIKKAGYRVGGMISSEVRVGGSRVGFEIIDLLTEQKGMLAHISQKEGPQVGKYRVNLRDLAAIGAGSLERAISDANLICCDEVGPMELYSPAFKKAVRNAMESGKPLLGTIHFKARDPLIDFIKSRADTEILEVKLTNRESLHGVVANKILKAISCV